MADEATAFLRIKRRSDEGRAHNRLLVTLYGIVAQLGEHLPCKQGVRSSTLLSSTTADSAAKALYIIAKKASEGIGLREIRTHP